MRVTNNMMINSLMYSLENNLNRMSVNQEHLNSGKKVLKASDDPISTAKILKYTTDISEFHQYEKNVNDALSMYEVTESSIAEVGQIIQRARELSVKAANGVNTPDDLQKIAAEVASLTDHLISSGNFSFAGKHIFSGYQTDKKLFNKDGSYNIDVTDREVSRPPSMELLVGARETMQITTSGIDVFGIAEGTNAFSSMFTDTAGDEMALNKSAAKGKFDLTESYSTGSIQIDFDGTTYTVDVTSLDGSDDTPLDEAVVLSRFNNATDGTQTLGAFANIYFDDNKNLVIEAKAQGSIAISANSTQFSTAQIYTGDIASKSVLKGSFTLDGVNANYTASNLDVTLYDLGGVPGAYVFDVDESTMNGHSFNLSKEDVLTKLRNAPLTSDPSQTLSQHADIYFDQNDQLMIKEKRYGNYNIGFAGSAGFTPALTTGQNTQEASLSFSQFTFDDAFITDIDNNADIKKMPLYITYGGQRKAVHVDQTVNITSAVQYRDEVQKAVDLTFGSGKIDVTLAGAAPNQYFEFATVNSVDGAAPQLRVETIKSQESSLIKDMQAFKTALETGDRAGVQNFLGLVDAHLNRVLSTRADVGAKVSRMELIKKRLSENDLSFTGMLSNVQDVDMAKEIMILKNAENIYRASLSTGSRVIQPTLMDFLR